MVSVSSLLTHSHRVTVLLDIRNQRAISCCERPKKLSKPEDAKPLRRVVRTQPIGDLIPPLSALVSHHSIDQDGDNPCRIGKRVPVVKDEVSVLTCFHRAHLVIDPEYARR